MTRSKRTTRTAAAKKTAEVAPEATEVAPEPMTPEPEAVPEPAEEPAKGIDDFTPTEAELAEAAALKDHLDSPESQAEIAAARTAATAPRTAPKTGRWFGAAQDKDGEAMVTAEPYGSSEMAVSGATRTLPRDPEYIVAVEAANADEALAIYEAIEDRKAAAGSVIAKPITPADRKALIETRTVPVEHTELLVSPTGIVHASDACRFVKTRDGLRVIPDADGTILANVVTTYPATTTWSPDDAAEDFKPIRLVGHCLFCSVTQAAPEPAAAQA